MGNAQATNGEKEEAGSYVARKTKMFRSKNSATSRVSRISKAGPVNIPVTTDLEITEEKSSFMFGFSDAFTSNQPTQNEVNKSNYKVYFERKTELKPLHPVTEGEEEEETFDMFNPDFKSGGEDGGKVGLNDESMETVYLFDSEEAKNNVLNSNPGSTVASSSRQEASSKGRTTQLHVGYKMQMRKRDVKKMTTQQGKLTNQQGSEKNASGKSSFSQRKMTSDMQYAKEKEMKKQKAKSLGQRVANTQILEEMEAKRDEKKRSDLGERVGTKGTVVPVQQDLFNPFDDLEEYDV